jgi:hypothetical protein
VATLGSSPRAGFAAICADLPGHVSCRISDRVHVRSADGVSEICNGKFRRQFQHTIADEVTRFAAAFIA